MISTYFCSVDMYTIYFLLTLIILNPSWKGSQIFSWLIYEGSEVLKEDVEFLRNPNIIVRMYW